MESNATVSIDVDKTVGPPISRYLTGKFCEHLGSNIYNGMDAQILRNHRFAAHPFGTPHNRPDGGPTFSGDPTEIRGVISRLAARWAVPSEKTDELITDYEAGLAFPWIAVGERKTVTVSPDVGINRSRAQRVEIGGGGAGIGQYVYLPLHRTRRYRLEVFARATEPVKLTVTLSHAAGRGAASCGLGPIGTQWAVYRGEIEVAGDENFPYLLSLTADAQANFVVSRVSLLPDDHVAGADPDVIRLLADSKLPLLRWPGGNFVSDYHWQDGVGPLDARPTCANPAWGSVEPNSFGTDEFMAFCKAVGCEPMICLNAGTGTPQEAAGWVEYCNGGTDTPFGALRAENGHPEPYAVRLWEIGNELSGRWQNNWTTPAGYADRYRRFWDAITRADPTITTLANGAQTAQGPEWNRTIAAELAERPSHLTDHPLVGAEVGPDTDPLEIYRDFTVFPLTFEIRFAKMLDVLRKNGVGEPRIAITELQLFAHLRQSDDPLGADSNAGLAAQRRPRLSRETLVSPPTMAEAVYETLYYHMAVRLAPAIEIITHSATVNHGGGLRKEREFVYANPCYYGRALFQRMTGATPVATQVECRRIVPPLVLSDLRSLEHPQDAPLVDALAAVDREQNVLLISLVSRATDVPVEVTIDLGGASSHGAAAAGATVREVSAKQPWDANSISAPDAIGLNERTIEVTDGILVVVKPFSVVQVQLPLG